MSCSAPATAMAATALAFSSLSLKTSHPCCTFFRPKNPKPQSGAGFRIGKMPGGVSFCSKDTETTFFESENPDAEQTEFNPPTPPEGYVPPTPFYEFPEETEEELGAAYEEIYGPAYSGESFLGKDVYVMDDKVKKKTGLGLRRRNVKVKDGFDERVVQVRRVTKVVKGGKQLHFRAVVVVGDKQGQVGVGVGKAKEVISAVEKSALNARRNIVSVPLTKYSTFPHRADGDYGAAKVMLRPASPGTGVIAGGAVRIVLEMAGVENALGKQIRSKNALMHSLRRHFTRIPTSFGRSFPNSASVDAIPSSRLFSTRGGGRGGSSTDEENNNDSLSSAERGFRRSENADHISPDPVWGKGSEADSFSSWSTGLTKDHFGGSIVGRKTDEGSGLENEIKIANRKARIFVNSWEDRWNDTCCLLKHVREPGTRGELLKEEEKKEMYRLHKLDPDKYDIERLAKTFRVMRQRVHAILWLKQMEEEEVKRSGKPLDDSIEQLIDACPEFFISHDISIKEDEMLYQEFVQNLNFNKKKIAGEVFHHKYSRRRPQKGWNVTFEKLGPCDKCRSGSAFRFVSLPDGSSRELNELEKMYAKRETPRHRRKILP